MFGAFTIFTFRFVLFMQWTFVKGWCRGTNDIPFWLGTGFNPCKSFLWPENYRPVALSPFELLFFVCSFVYCLTSRLSIFCSWLDFSIVCQRLQNSSLYSTPKVFEQGVFLVVLHSFGLAVSVKGPNPRMSYFTTNEEYRGPVLSG